MENKGLRIGIAVLVILVLGLSGYIIYDKIVNDKDEIIDNSDKIEDNVNNEDESILSEELSLMLDYFNMDCQAFSQCNFYNVVSNDDLILNKNFFDDDLIKKRVAMILGNIKGEQKDEDDVTQSVYVDYDKFSAVYKEVWDENLDSSNVENGKYYVFSYPTGAGQPAVNFKIKSIEKQNDTYILKTSVGILYEEKIVYDYENNYEGQIKFKKSGNYYKMESFIIK